MNLFSAIPLITAFIVFFWGSFVFSKDPKNITVRLFLVLSIVTAYESIFEFLYISSYTLEQAKFFYKYHLWGWPLLYALQFHFLIRYAKINIKNPKVILGIIYIVTFSLILYISFFEPYATLVYEYGGWIRIPQTIHETPEYIFATYMTVITLSVTFFGIQYLIKSKGKTNKLRASFILTGMLIILWVPSLKNALLPDFFNISLLFPDSAFIFTGWAFITIAILYFKMFDITPQSASDKILETMNEALILSDKDGKVVWANQRFFELFEMDSYEIDDHTLELLNQINSKAIDIIGLRYQTEELRNLIIPITTFKNNLTYIGLSTSFFKNEFKETVGFIAIMNDISELIIAQNELKDQQKAMLEMAHQAGMSEVTTSVIHNIGNILNSVNVSSEYMNLLLKNSKIDGLLKANELLEKHKDNLADFFSNNPKGKILSEYYQTIGKELKNENEKLRAEEKNLSDKIRLIKDAIDIQQDYSKVRNLNEPIHLKDLIEEVVSVLEESFKKYEINFQKQYPEKADLVVVAPASKLINVLLNILKNAAESVRTIKNGERLIHLKVNEKAPKDIEIIISDNGIGIPRDALSNIFKFGYTTKESGHGYGLHFCANVLKEMNGSVIANSEGENNGAEFVISFPKKQ